MSTLVGFAALLGFVVLVAQPFRRRLEPQATASAEKERQEALEARKRELVSTLRDLNLDFQMGKLDEADFRELEGRYRAEAVDILRTLDRLGSRKAHWSDSRAEELVAAYRRRKQEAATSTPCTTCGSVLKPHYRFCPGCGSLVETGSVSGGDAE